MLGSESAVDPFDDKLDTASTALQARLHPQTACVRLFWYAHNFIEAPPPPGSYTGLEVSWKSAEGVIVIADHLRPCSKDRDCGMYLKEL